MQQAISRGGQKPTMLTASRSVPITVQGRPKHGMYEINRDGCLARRVELPHWLSDAIDRGEGFGARCRAGEQAGSGGHIFMNPPKSLFDGPAVGLDMEAWALVQSGQVKKIKFYIYRTGYRLAAVWFILAEDFIEQAKRVQTSEAFMPQMMVPISSLDSVCQR